jgi:hypothetical protein
MPARQHPTASVPLVGLAVALAALPHRLQVTGQRFTLLELVQLGLVPSGQLCLISLFPVGQFILEGDYLGRAGYWFDQRQIFRLVATGKDTV